MTGRGNKTGTRSDTKGGGKSGQEQEEPSLLENGAAGGSSDTSGMSDQQFKKLHDLLISLDSKVEDNGRRIKKLEDDVKHNHDDLKRELNTKINNLTTRVSNLEGSVGVLKQTIDTIKKPEFESDCTVIISNLSEGAGESDDALLQKVDRVLSVGLELPGIEPVAIRRLQGRNNNPGIVKVELVNLDAKKEVLSAKRKLNERGEFKNLYVRSAEDHSVRLMKLNLNTVLKELNFDRRFRYTGSGRLVKRDGARDRGTMLNNVPEELVNGGPNGDGARH